MIDVTKGRPSMQELVDELSLHGGLSLHDFDAAAHQWFARLQAKPAAGICVDFSHPGFCDTAYEALAALLEVVTNQVLRPVNLLAAPNAEPTWPQVYDHDEVF